jgi:hypothetical protein
MTANRRKPGPKLPYTDEMLERAIEAAEADQDVAEICQKSVAEKLNHLFRLNYRPRAGDMESNIKRILDLRHDEQARRRIASLPSEVVARFDADLQDYRYRGLLNIAEAHGVLTDQIQIPLTEAEQEVRRMRTAYDAEREARMQETKRATEAEKRVLTIQKKLDAEERKSARFERKIQTLNRSNADDATLISKADLAQFLSEVVAKNGLGGV